MKVSNIRTEELNPGIVDYEMQLLKLIDRITNGSVVDINVSGTQVKFTPGIITNNDGEEFTMRFACFISSGLQRLTPQCSSEKMETQDRCITYYLEFLLPVVLFGKRDFNCEFIGITNDNVDVSVDSFKK